MSLSYWERSIYFDDLHLLVVGSGIVGLCTAISYKQKFPQHKVLIVERGILPMGASTKNAGFACFGSVSELLDDFENMDAEVVWQTVEMRINGLRKLIAILGESKIVYEHVGGYEIFDDSATYDYSKSNMNNLNHVFETRFGLKNVYQVQANTFGFKGIKGIIKNKYEGALNTGKMMQALQALAIELGVLILNGVEVIELNDSNNGVSVRTKTFGDILSHKVVVATNGFAKQLYPELPVNANRAQVLVTKPIENLPFKGTFHYDKGYYYFRHTSDNRLIIGGGRNKDFKGEQTFELGESEIIQQSIESLLSSIILPTTKFEIDYRWSGIMGLGEEKMPIIKHVSNNVVCAVKLGGMGIAIGSIVAEKAAELIAQ
jgi:gamma-glutamylputrescine oxidase